MDFSSIELTGEYAAFQQEVRDFIAEHITPEVYEHQERTGDGFNRAVHLALGEKGWIFPKLPKEEGGAGLDDLKNRILELELHKTHLPMITMSTTRLVRSAVAQFGNDEIRDEVLAGMAKGTVLACLGYTEPEGGSDIAAARTKAVKDGDEWVINGSKMFTTGAHNSQYTFLITRTDPTAPKHKGLTMFLVPLDTPGVEIQPVHAFSGERTNLVFYGDVRISDKWRLGGVNDGWSVLHGPLDEEHSLDQGKSGLEDISVAINFLREVHFALDDVRGWVNEPGANGLKPADDPVVLNRLGSLVTDIFASYATPGPSGRIKGGDMCVTGSAELIDIVGPRGTIKAGEAGVIGSGQIEFAHRFAQGAVTYVGTVEVFRTIVAQHVLGLPRPNYPGAKMLV